jgi:hypothetical protein
MDETAYSGNIDITVNFNKGDLQSLNENLKNYGLTLRIVERYKDVLVINKRNPL